MNAISFMSMKPYRVCVFPFRSGIELLRLDWDWLWLGSALWLLLLPFFVSPIDTNSESHFDIFRLLVSLPLVSGLCRTVSELFVCCCYFFRYSVSHLFHWKRWFRMRSNIGRFQIKFCHSFRYICRFGRL